MFGDDARLHERDDAVGDHFGVDPEVLPVAEELDGRVGNAADAELQRRAVFDQAGHVLADLPVDLELFGRFVPFHLRELLQGDG